MEKRKKSDAGFALINHKLDQICLKTAQYFADKRKKSLYVAGHDMMIMNTKRFDNVGIYCAHITYYHEYLRDVGRALRMLLYGFVLQDINDTIIVSSCCEHYILDLFDDSSIDEKLSGLVLRNTIIPSYVIIPKDLKRFSMPYPKWNAQWIVSLLKTAIKYEDPDMFVKILNKLDYTKHDKLLHDLMNANIPVEYKALISRWIPKTTPALEL